MWIVIATLFGQRELTIMDERIAQWRLIEMRFAKSGSKVSQLLIADDSSSRWMFIVYASLELQNCLLQILTQR